MIQVVDRAHEVAFRRVQWDGLNMAQGPGSSIPSGGGQSDRRVSRLPPEILEEAQRRAAAQFAEFTKNNRYGAVSPCLAHALEVMTGLDPKATSHRLLRGASIEDLLAESAPIGDAALTRIRVEVRDLFTRFDSTPDQPERLREAVHNMGKALSLIEQSLLE